MHWPVYVPEMQSCIKHKGSQLIMSNIYSAFLYGSHALLHLMMINLFSGLEIMKQTSSNTLFPTFKPFCMGLLLAALKSF